MGRHRFSNVGDDAMKKVVYDDYYKENIILEIHIQLSFVFSQIINRKELYLI